MERRVQTCTYFSDKEWYLDTWNTSRCHINSETFSLQVNIYDSTRLKDNSEGLGMWNSWSLVLPNCSQSVRGIWSCFSIPVSGHDTTREWRFERFSWHHPSCMVILHETNQSLPVLDVIASAWTSKEVHSLQKLWGGMTVVPFSATQKTSNTWL